MPREIDVARREVTIILARVHKLSLDADFLRKALRDLEEYVTSVGNKEEVQSEAYRQPTLAFGSGSVEDHD